MKKLAYNCFYILGLSLVPIVGLAQQQETVTTVSDSLTTTTIVVSDSLKNAAPLGQLNIVQSSQTEDLTLFKPTESSSYDLQDNALAAKFDSLWMKELVEAAPLYNEMYEEILVEPDTASTFVLDLPTDTLKMRLARLNAKTPFNVEYNKSLESVIKSFLTRKRGLMERMLTISQFYFPLFEQEFDNKNIPLEMKYLSIVESALNPKARSRVGATGLWQFMYGTGKEMKLNINSYVDERSDPIKSTAAAANYLNRLHRIYDDWDLALAAYNSGPGNVNKAIRRSGGQRNYWNIRRNLPRETAGYVPAFQATMYIFEYAEEHGLKTKIADRAYFETDTIHVKSLITFDQISELAAIDKEELKVLNPHYKLDVIPFIEGKPNALRLPVHKMGKFVANEKAIYAHVEKELKEKEGLVAEIEKQAEANSIRYRVRDGDFLGKIAERYGVRVSQLKQWNGLRSNNLRIGQRLTIYPRKNASSSVKPKETPSRTTVASNSKTHEVRSGDSLWTISRKYPGVTIENLRKWNGISGNNLKLGTKLKLCDCSS
ncbi:LysM peptidoglycan-binding domain-containing protein [Maribacter forsetii]|uniref:LysM peptidoglycan-binding domain-containing protein n=1 Tax=Maribacter forsetii TaxID=444515 RepID=UPI000A00E1C5|nr:LysM peptidoglycan-binding domain-containing protein [Maribacter forsetii]